jgi:hypothetical protein
MLKNFREGGLVATAILTISLNGCGSSTSSSALSTLSGLPKATSPVADTGGSVVLASAATTGVPVMATVDADWGAATSRGFCESTSLIRDAFRQAGNPDKVLCYIGVMQNENSLAANLDDGSYHYYTVSGTGDVNAHDLKVKFKIVKGSDGKISDFTMFSCQNGTAQTEYMNETITASDVTLTSVQSSSNDLGDWASRTTVTGTINSSGAWTSKVIAISQTGSGGSGGTAYTSSQEATITQHVSSIILDAFRTGTYGGHPNVSKIYSEMQTLNTDALSTFALGEGSSHVDIDYNNGAFTSTTTTSWDGDTKIHLADITAGTYYASTLAATLRNTEAVSISFSGAETWDCAPPSGESFGTADFGAVQASATGGPAIAACDTNFSDTHDNFLQCNTPQN